jgi:hypothetical protein
MCTMESRVEHLSKQKCLLRPRRKAGAGGNDPVAPRGNRGLAPVQLAWRKFSYVTAPSQRPFPDVHQYTKLFHHFVRLSTLWLPQP